MRLTDLPAAGKAEKAKMPPAAWLFFQRWMANPKSMGSITPSSAALRKLVRENIVCGPDEVVVEFGGGTGAITRALLEAGIPGERVYSFELDNQLARYLRGAFPDINVIADDCRKAAELLGPEIVGRVGTVVICIPTATLPPSVQREVVDAAFSIMPRGNRFILYTYMPKSTLNQKALNIRGKRLDWTPLNVPPASVWGYWRDEQPA